MITGTGFYFIIILIDGIPGVKWFGSEGDYNVLVIDLLGRYTTINLSVWIHFWFFTLSFLPSHFFIITFYLVECDQSLLEEVIIVLYCIVLYCVV